MDADKQYRMREYTVFFFNDTATTEIYTLSLHDALPIFGPLALGCTVGGRCRILVGIHAATSLTRIRLPGAAPWRSEEHTSELQSRQYLVCRLLLEKKKYMLPISYYFFTASTSELYVT